MLSKGFSPRSSWRVATPEELALSLLPSQSDSDSDSSRCSFAFKHGCLGACRGLRQGYVIGSRRAATEIFTDGAKQPNDVLAGLRRMLFGVIADGSNGHSKCTIGFAGDSTMHDFWSASVAGAMKLGFSPLVLGVASRLIGSPTRCICSAGTMLWHALENSTGTPFCVSHAHEPGACYVLFQVSRDAMRRAHELAAGASSYADAMNRTTGSSPSVPLACRTLRLRYFQIVPTHHLDTLPAHHRPLASPREMLGAVSVLIYNAGAWSLGAMACISSAHTASTCPLYTTLAHTSCS